jgi:hypothetical protein
MAAAPTSASAAWPAEMERGEQRQDEKTKTSVETEADSMAGVRTHVARAIEGNPDAVIMENTMTSVETEAAGGLAGQGARGPFGEGNQATAITRDADPATAAADGQPSQRMPTYSTMITAPSNSTDAMMAESDSALRADPDTDAMMAESDSALRADPEVATDATGGDRRAKAAANAEVATDAQPIMFMDGAAHAARELASLAAAPGALTMRIFDVRAASGARGSAVDAYAGSAAGEHVPTEITDHEMNEHETTIYETTDYETTNHRRHDRLRRPSCAHHYLRAHRRRRLSTAPHGHTRSCRAEGARSRERLRRGGASVEGALPESRGSQRMAHPER